MANERAIVVGAGGIAAAWFPPLANEGVKIEAVVDIRLDAARQRIGEYKLEGAEAATNLGAMLRKHKPDFVVDLTIPEAHCKVCTAAMKAGCHAVSEKPMAASMAQARRLVATAEKTGRMYMVSQSRRWDAHHDTVQRTISAGRIGGLTTINCDFYLGAHFGGFRDAMPSPLILDMAIHHFDMARFMTGTDPVSVYAQEFNPRGSWYKGSPAASVIFEMSNGAVFTYRGSWCAEGCHTSWNGDWRFIGDKGTLLYAQDKMPYGEIVKPDTRPGFVTEKQPVELVGSPLQYKGMHGALREMLEFLRTGRKPQTECHDNIKSLAMVFAAIESSRQGKRVRVKW
jgi:predicted dehydrogenase